MNDIRDRIGRLEQDPELKRVDDLLTQALWPAVASSRGSGRSASTEGALAEACRIARARRLQPEQVIIMLKAAWDRVRDTRYATRDVAQEALDRAVTACIWQYFNDHADSAACRTFRQR